MSRKQPDLTWTDLLSRTSPTPRSQIGNSPLSRSRIRLVGARFRIADRFWIVKLFAMNGTNPDFAHALRAR